MDSSNGLEGANAWHDGDDASSDRESVSHFMMLMIIVTCVKSASNE